MDPISQLRKHLQSFKKSTVSLSELETIFLGQPCTYEEFSRFVLKLEAEGNIQMFQSKGRTSKQPSLDVCG